MKQSYSPFIPYLLLLVVAQPHLVLSAISKKPNPPPQHHPPNFKDGTGTTVLVLGLLISSSMAVCICASFFIHLNSWRQALMRCHSVDSIINQGSVSWLNLQLMRCLIFYLCLLGGCAGDIPFLGILLWGQWHPGYDMPRVLGKFRTAAHLQLTLLFVTVEFTIRDWRKILDPYQGHQTNCWRARPFGGGGGGGGGGVRRLARARACWEGARARLLGAYLVYGGAGLLLPPLPPAAQPWWVGIGALLRAVVASFIVCGQFAAGWHLQVRMKHVIETTHDAQLKQIRWRLILIISSISAIVMVQTVFFLTESSLLNTDRCPWVVWLPLVSWAPALGVGAAGLYLYRPPVGFQFSQRRAGTENGPVLEPMPTVFEDGAEDSCLLVEGYKLLGGDENGSDDHNEHSRSMESGAWRALRKESEDMLAQSVSPQ